MNYGAYQLNPACKLLLTSVNQQRLEQFSIALGLFFIIIIFNFTCGYLHGAIKMS